MDGHAESGDLVDFGQRLGQLGSVALGHASGDDETGRRIAPPVDGDDRVDRLLAGIFDERTGVHDHEICSADIVGRQHAVGQQGADQLVGIDLILRAAESLDIEALGHDPPRLSAATS